MTVEQLPNPMMLLSRYTVFWTCGQEVDSATFSEQPTSSRPNKDGKLLDVNTVPFSAISLITPTLIILPNRRRFDLQNPSRTERNVEMFGAIERALIQVSHKETNRHQDKPNSVH